MVQKSKAAMAVALALFGAAATTINMAVVTTASAQATDAAGISAALLGAVATAGGATPAQVAANAASAVSTVLTASANAGASPAALVAGVKAAVAAGLSASAAAAGLAQAAATLAAQGSQGAGALQAALTTLSQDQAFMAAVGNAQFSVSSTGGGGPSVLTDFAGLVLALAGAPSGPVVVTIVDRCDPASGDYCG